MKRRHFLATLSSTLMYQQLRSLHLVAQAIPQFKSDPFLLGVASGDPDPHGAVIWTRLVTDVMAPDLGMPPTNIPVDWEVASDAAMRNIVKKGTATAIPELGHSIHVEVTGLQPARHYYYRFNASGAASPIGRMKTAPALDAGNERVRFAFASCQHYEWGFYTAHRDMAQQDLDAVVFLGDYIYEHHILNRPASQKPRLHNIDVALTLSDYRRHYAQYKSDPDLLACHQAHTWIVTPDDHEVENNWAGDEGKVEHGQKFLARRTAAYQAYYENMPLRRLCQPSGSHIQLYRNIPYGKLMQFMVLDTRQFRTPHPCNDEDKSLNCKERYAPNSTMMGSSQEKWFAKSMTESHHQWNVVANQVRIAQWAVQRKNGLEMSTDSWDGYVAARQRLLDFLATAKPRNPFFITGDAHTTDVADLLHDFNNPKSEIVASEFLGTSIASKGDGQEYLPAWGRIKQQNPHVKYNNDQRGYVICTADTQRLTSELRVAPIVSKRDGAVRKEATFVVESDKKGIHQES